jgi:signal transduction histidine kinase
MQLRATAIPASGSIARDNALPALRGRRLLLARAVWLILALISLGLFAASIPFDFAWRQQVCASSPCPEGYLSLQNALGLRELGLTTSAYATYILAVDSICTLGYLAVGVFIFRHKSDDRLALLVALALVLFGATWPIIPDFFVSAPAGVQWLAGVWAQLGITAFFLLALLFPDGRFAPRWVRWLALVVLAGQMLAIVFPGTPMDIDSWSGPASAVSQVGIFGLLVFTQAYRYMRVSSPVQRQQTKWVVFGLALTVVGTIFALLLGALLPALTASRSAHLVYEMASRLFSTLTLLLIPLSIAIAVLRYRLWDIDILINRTLVYGALSASVVTLYTVIVGGLGALLQDQGSLLISLLGTGLIAVLFQPLRDRLQRGANRLMYGERDDPYAVITRLGRRLEITFAPDTVLPTIVQTVQETLRLPYVAIALDYDGVCTAAASVGTPSSVAASLPLVYQNETVGQLILAPRAADEPFSAADRRLLGDQARQAGVAAHAVRLTSALQRSRERLVTAREEERRRLRRDLHDGLGPALATVTLQAEAARDLISSAPQRSAALLDDLIAQSQTAIADIRRLVYDLRPPALDDLGFVGALRAQAARYDHSGLRITLDAPADLPPLSAAVEVAAYRIVQEALTNVARHAQARSCTIRLALASRSRQPNGDDSTTGSDLLALEICDDGRGLAADRRAGVGLSSMRERAAELGGTCTIEPAPAGGTRVQAQLPLLSVEQ